MREILFRGKRVDNGEWVYGYYTKHKTGKVFIKEANADCKRSFEVIPESVGQYTGLKANDKKIFEGDIIKVKRRQYPERINGEIVWRATSCCGEVIFCGGAYFYGDWLLSTTAEKGREIIGNIYDNPELLEVE